MALATLIMISHYFINIFSFYFRNSKSWNKIRESWTCALLCRLWYLQSTHWKYHFHLILFMNCQGLIFLCLSIAFFFKTFQLEKKTLIKCARIINEQLFFLNFFHLTLSKLRISKKTLSLFVFLCTMYIVVFLNLESWRWEYLNLEIT